MIYEYALDPEIVVEWSKNEYAWRFYKRAFSLSQGRLVSRFPDNWVKKVWNSFDGDTTIDKKRLEVLLASLKNNMVKRKNRPGDPTGENWFENALQENTQYPFYAIMSNKNKSEECSEVLADSDLNKDNVEKWDIPHGITVKRNAKDMASAVEMMLSRCQWVKFIDPYLSSLDSKYEDSFRAFLKILTYKRPFAFPISIEIHIKKSAGKYRLLDDEKVRFINKFKSIIPENLKITLFQWNNRKDGQGPRLHNRFILTDTGGVTFLHGLRIGEEEGEEDCINRLDFNQYDKLRKHYCSTTTAFDKGEEPIEIIGAAE
jgi:hypothetical protein